MTSPKEPDAKPADPLESQEVGMLNSILARVHPLARDGDPEAIDRVLKILDLKRKLRLDARARADEWEGG